MSDTLEDKIIDALSTPEWAGSIAHAATIAAKVAREHYHDIDKHLVRITYLGRTRKWEWNLQHPLACRTEGIDGLINCEVNKLLVEEGPPAESGLFEVESRMSLEDGELDPWLVYTRVPEPPK